jgi:Peptidase family M28/PDZ domain/PA domain
LDLNFPHHSISSLFTKGLVRSTFALETACVTIGAFFKSQRRSVIFNSPVTAKQRVKWRTPMNKTKRVFRRGKAAVLVYCLTLLASISASALEIPRAPAVATDTLRVHTRYLASDELTGRGVETAGIKLARDYIMREFTKYGLRPGGDNGSFLQSFDVTTGVKVVQPTELVAPGAPLVLNADWTPLGLSASGNVAGELVFAGYGITDKESGYDDYDGVDAKGKIVLLLRYEPPPKDAKGPFRKAPHYSRHAMLRAKTTNARAHGAAGMILVDLDYAGDEPRELIDTSGSIWRGGKSLVAAQVKRRVVARWLESDGVSLASLKAKIDGTGRPASRPLPGSKIALTVTLQEIRDRTENVLAVLPGSDESLKKEHIIVGAHYDHLGFGHYGIIDSSAEGEIHHGADDNASGLAVLLSVAEQLSRVEPKPARTIVFAAFSGEELGLFGSRHYVNHPTLALASTKAMINLDMVGRLRDERLTIFGAHSGKDLSAIVNQEGRRLGLEIQESDAIGRSDNVSFYNKKIPTLHFFTGGHADYHRPSDTWDKLNYDGMSRISALVLATARRLADTAEAPQFVALPLRPRTGNAPALRSYLGSIPVYDGGSDGVKLAGVSAESPAARAGLHEGDVIIRFAGIKIQNVEDLMAQLSAKNPGDEVEIVVRRGAQSVTVRAVLRVRG